MLIRHLSKLLEQKGGRLALLLKDNEALETVLNLMQWTYCHTLDEALRKVQAQ